MTIGQLKAEIARRQAEGQSAHNQVMTIQKKFSIPVACLVFGLLGLGLGISNRKDGKQSSFVVAIAVIFVYYVFMYSGESAAKARWIPAWVAMWIPNIVLGAAGAALLAWRARHGDTGGGISIRLPWRLPVQPEATRPAPPARATSGRDRTVVVVRIPQIRMPTLRIVDRYVAGIYLRVFGIAFVGMLALFYIATFIDLSDKLFKGQATIGQLLQFFWYSTPQYIYYVLPLSALITTLVTIGLLTRTSELVVMKACGISLYRAALPLIGFGLLWSGVLFGLGESILAEANRQAQALNHVIRGGSPRTFDVLSRQWVAGRDGSLYNFLAFSPREHELDGLSIYRFAPGSWDLASRMFVTEARFVDGQWQARRGWTRTFDQAAAVTAYDPFDHGVVKIEAVDYFMTERPDAERMNYRQLRQYVGELRTSGFNVTPYVVALHRKLSFPAVTVIMTLIAVPFAVTTGRRGALYGIGVGIVLALTYWLIFSVFAAIGTAGLLSPPLAAWAPNILFASVAVYLLLTVRT
jgi:LPS export ABC transporter permease LptG